MKKNISHSFAFLSFILFLLTSAFSCSKDNIVSPPELQPGRRNYTWTVDTLYLPFNPFTDITGTSPTDLWVCGPGDADKIFYHYNKNIWTTDYLFRIFSPLSISSLGIDNIWSCGLDGKIWARTGDIWKEDFRLVAMLDTIISFQKINAISNQEVYAVGEYYLSSINYWGIILKYDGKSWKNLGIPKTKTFFVDIKKNFNSNIYLLGKLQHASDENEFQFYELIGNMIHLLYTGSQSSTAENGSLIKIGSEVYFIIGYNLYQYSEGRFSLVAELKVDERFKNSGIGRNTKDIFLFMSDGIAHYNGENSVYLYQTKDKCFIVRGIVFEKDVFFLGRDANGNNLIFHGKLNE